jgi:5-methylcytosine-specific restriction protein A
MAKKRLSPRKRGYIYRWEVCRKLFLQRNPLCRICESMGFDVPATVIDHIQAHRGDPRLFWDEDNWQALCAPCHDTRKQADDLRGYHTAIGPDGWPTDPRHPHNALKT